MNRPSVIAVLSRPFAVLGAVAIAAFVAAGLARAEPPAPASTPAQAADTGVPADFQDGTFHALRYPDWFKTSFYNLRDDAEEAAADGKQGLFLFFSTEGCSYCHLFIEQSLGDPAIAARLQRHFDSLGFEIFSDAELTDFAGGATRVNAFALAEGVQFAPTLLFYDTDGQRLVRLTGYYEPLRFNRVLDWLIDGHHADTPLRAFLAADAAADIGTADWSLPPDPLFASPPYALDRSRMAAERPLLVLFEANHCPRCGRFHREVLGDAGIRERLAGLEVVRLDAADAATPVLAPDGSRTTPRDWYQTLGFTELPALVFFDEGGRAVLSTDAVVLASRMQNSLGFVTDRAYEQGWTYQRYARSQAMKKAAARAKADGGADGAAD